MFILKAYKLILVAVVVVYVAAQSAIGAPVDMHIHVEGFAAENHLSLFVEGENVGKQFALQVKMEVLFPDLPQATPLYQIVQADQKFDHVFEYDLPEGRKYKQIAVPLRRYYSDYLHKMHSSVQCSVIAMDGGALDEGLTAAIESVELSDENEVKVSLGAVDGKLHSVEVRLVAPVEFSINPRTIDVIVPVNGSATATFNLKNFSATLGVHDVWAVVSEKKEDGIVETAAKGVAIVVVAPKSFFSLGRIIAFVVVGLCLIGYVMLSWAARKEEVRDQMTDDRGQKSGKKRSEDRC